MAKKKPQMSMADQVMIGLCVLSGFLCLVLCIPKVPYRLAAMYGGYHSRFSMTRSYSLWGATDNLGSIVSWMTLRSETCRQMAEYNARSPLLAIGAMAATSAIGSGGAVAGCANWTLCKEHMVLRCNQYMTVMIVGIFAILFNIVGAVALFMVPMMVNSEKEFLGKSKKKKKKLVQAATLSLQTVVAGFVFPLLSYAMYMLTTDAMFHAFANKSSYPYGYASAGAFVSGTVIGLTAIALLLAVWRWSKTGVDEKGGGEGGSDDEMGEPGGDEFQDPLMPAPGAAPPGMGPPGM